MRRELTAIIEREGDGYVALCPEVDVASQGDSAVEARENLQEAITLFFETAPVEEIERRLSGGVYLTLVEEDLHLIDNPPEDQGGRGEPDVADDPEHGAESNAPPSADMRRRRNSAGPGAAWQDSSIAKRGRLCSRGAEARCHGHRKDGSNAGRWDGGFRRGGWRTRERYVHSRGASCLRFAQDDSGAAAATSNVSGREHRKHASRYRCRVGARSMDAGYVRIG